MKKSRPPTNVKTDGIIRVQREVKGRKGKTVTTVSGFQITADELKNLAAQLKRRCGTGGSVKDGIIIIQGDHRDGLLSELKKQGYPAKLAGGGSSLNNLENISFASLAGNGTQDSP
jgi:translation initiation factor 1